MELYLSQFAELSRDLYFIISGGGPGAAQEPKRRSPDRNLQRPGCGQRASCSQVGTWQQGPGGRVASPAARYPMVEMELGLGLGGHRWPCGLHPEAGERIPGLKPSAPSPAVDRLEALGSWGGLAGTPGTAGFCLTGQASGCQGPAQRSRHAHRVQLPQHLAGRGWQVNEEVFHIVDAVPSPQWGELVLGDRAEPKLPGG